MRWKFIFIIAFANLSCNQSNLKKDLIIMDNLDISFGLTYYEYKQLNQAGSKLESSKIALSDSILLLFNDNFFVTEKGMPKISLWIKGKEINTSDNFDTLKTKYKLKESSIYDFLNQSEDSLVNYSICFPYDKDFRVKKLKNDVVVRFPRTNYKRDSVLILNVCHKGRIENVPVNYSNSIPIYPSILFYDITGDGVEEIFIGQQYLTGHEELGYSTVSVYSIGR
ncbi:MAG: hypothetical protein Q4G27_09680 [Flavobacteriaceae bacterium]|nr:hypothetical protein [Flavobacteriaceae bacterium]